MVPPAGFEPATHRVEAGCSNPLSYGGDALLKCARFPWEILTHSAKELEYAQFYAAQRLDEGTQGEF